MIYLFEKLWLILIAAIALTGVTVTQFISVTVDPKNKLLWWGRHQSRKAWVEAVKSSYLQRSQELRAYRECRKARYGAAGKGFLTTMDKYLMYNRGYGHVVIGLYVFFIAFLGHIIGVLVLTLTGVIIVP